MPVVDIPIPDGREPGRTTNGYGWGPRYRADAADPANGNIDVDVEFYATTDAAFAGADLAGRRSFSLSGREYRNFVRRNKALVLATIAAIDVEIQRRFGGTIVLPQLGPWADEPEEPEPEPEPAPQPES